MNRVGRISPAIVAVFGVCACGDDAYILLDVTAACGADACIIPTDVDRLQVAVQSATGNPLSQGDFELHAGLSFPIEVLLTPGDSTPDTIRQELAFYLSDAIVAQKVIEHPWQPSGVSRVEVIIDVR